MINKDRELNIRKVIIISFIVVLIIAIVLIFSLYIAEEDFRKWIDTNVFRKDINTEDVATIDLDTEKNNQIYCYSKYICILNDKKLQIYNSSGSNIEEISLEINTALFASEDKYLAIAEDGGQKICVISNQTYLWDNQVDGEILQIYINENGYVAVVTTDTTYRSIITLFNSEGKQVLKNYSSSTRVIDVSISNDNKYIAFAEMDTSGTLIQSNIKIISVEEEAIIYTKEADVSKMAVNIKYQDKGELVCIYNDSVNIINEETDTEIFEVSSDVTFLSGELDNRVAYISEETSGLFNYNSTLTIINTSNNQTYTYNFDEVAKEMYTHGNIIGINIGTEIYFINSSGMLLKKYSSSQEITNVVISNDLAIIIYKDKIEIIDI